MLQIPKFFDNFDNNHCLHACIRMTAETMGVSMPFDELDRLMEYDDKLYTWTIQGAKVLAEKFSAVQIKSVFNHDEFARDGEPYLAKQWASIPNRLDHQRQHASPGFQKEQNATKKFLQDGGKADIVAFDHPTLVVDLQANFVIAQVSHSILMGDNKPNSHFVLLYGSRDSGISFYLHDPGLPGRSELCIPSNLFWVAFQGEMILVPRPAAP